MQSPIVSVLMPVYNGSDHVAESIRSILAQSLRDLELVIIDDGSTDNTMEIINSFADARIRVFQNDRNLKIARSLNRGLRLCRGGFVARMDCDDVCHPERLERQIKFLHEHPDISICGTFQKYFGGYHDRRNRTVVTHEEIVAALLFSPTMFHSTVVFRASAVHDHALYYDENFEYCEDYELWVRAADSVRLANLPEYLSSYRWARRKTWEADEPGLMEGLRSIWSRQLARLGIVPSASDLHIHAIIAQRGMADTYSVLSQARAYLSRLIELNRVARIYDARCFVNQIRRVWRVLCLRVARSR